MDRVLDLLVERARLDPSERAALSADQLRFSYPSGFDPFACAEKSRPWEEQLITELEADGLTEAVAEMRAKQKKREWWYRRETPSILATIESGASPLAQ
jgi:hypothetical protein